MKIAIVSKKTVPDIALIDSAACTRAIRPLSAHGTYAITHSVETYVKCQFTGDLYQRTRINEPDACTSPFGSKIKERRERHHTVGSLLAGVLRHRITVLALFMRWPIVLVVFLISLMANAMPFCWSMLWRLTILRAEAVRNDWKTLGLDFSGGSVAEKKEKIISGIASLRETLGVSETLNDLGVKKQDIPSLSRNPLQIPCMATNPRKPTIKDIERIYEEAL